RRAAPASKRRRPCHRPSTQHLLEQRFGAARGGRRSSRSSPPCGRGRRNPHTGGKQLMSLYHRFKDRFGTAGVVLGVIAMILAVGGSAIAASGLNGKQKKEVKA